MTDKELKDMTEPELRKYFRDLARKIEGMLPPGPSRSGKCMFLLLVCDESQIGQYVCNMERDGAINLMRETADRLAGREDIPR